MPETSEASEQPASQEQRVVGIIGSLIQKGETIFPDDEASDLIHFAEQSGSVGAAGAQSLKDSLGARAAERRRQQEQRVSGIIGMLIGKGEEVFSDDEAEDLIQFAKDAGSISEGAASGLKGSVAERAEKRRQNQEQRVSGIISSLIGKGESTFSKEEANDLIQFSQGTGSISEETANNLRTQLSERTPGV